MSSISAGTTINTGLTYTSDTTGTLQIKTGASGATAIHVDAAQNVGFGTTSPSTYGKLVVDSGRAYIRGSASANQGEIDLQNTDASGGTWRIGDSISTPAGVLAIYRGGTGLGASIDASLNFAFNSGYGSAGIAYGCRSWVNFNGQGTIAILGSGNITSVTRFATACYDINMANAMPDTGYSIGGSVQNGSMGFAMILGLENYTYTRVKTTTTARIYTRHDNYGLVESADVSVSIFR